MPKQPTLQSVRADFQHWRANKSTLGPRIPDDLRRDAVALLGELSASTITTAIGVSCSMLKAWRNEQPQPTDIPIEFIALPSPAPATEPPIDALTLSVTQPNGAKWQLQGCMNPEQLGAIIHAVGGLSGGGQ